MSGEDRMNLSALPVYLGLGHGLEEASVFCTPKEREKQAAQIKKARIQNKDVEDMVHCRFLCPDNTYIILFSEMGSTVPEMAAEELANVFRKNNSRTADMLHQLPHMPGALDAVAPFKDMHFSVYTPGSQVPLLYFDPVNLRSSPADASIAGISNSGVYAYPILAEPYIDLDVTGANYVNDMDIANIIFKDAVYPKLSNIAKYQYMKWSQLGDKFTRPISRIVKHHGPGIYYFPICRLCEDQYYDPAELKNKLMKYQNLEDEEFKRLSTKKYKEYKLLRAHWNERDKTKVTNLSIPSLRKLTKDETKTHFHILQQRGASKERQTKIKDEFLRGIQVVESPAAASAASSAAPIPVDLTETSEDEPEDTRKDERKDKSQDSSEDKKSVDESVNESKYDASNYVYSSGEEAEIKRSAAKKRKITGGGAGGAPGGRQKTRRRIKCT
jgi:hypothetical protein